MAAERTPGEGQDQSLPSRAWQAFSTRADWQALALILTAGLLVRLWAMHWPPFPTDMEDWIGWGERLRSVGPSHFYANGVFADYAPGYLYVLWLTAIVKHALLPQEGVGAYYPLFRLPPILCDLATAALIFFAVQRLWPASESRPGERWPLAASLAAAAYAFNPATILNSAVWGQIDATYTLFLLLAVLLLGSRPKASVLCYVAALLIKPQAISLAPVMAVGLLMRYPWRIQTFARAAAGGLALAFLLLFPFFGFDMIPRFLALLRRSSEAYPYSSLFAYNLWGVYGFWKADSARFSGSLSLFSLGLWLYGAGIWYGVVVLEDQLRRRTAFLYTTLLLAAYFAMLPYMVLTRMHERYIHPVLPFLLLFGVLCLRLGRQRDGQGFVPRFTAVPLLLYAAVTALYTVDLYHVYTYYRNLNHGVPQSNVVFHAIENNAPVWCVLMLLSFWALLSFLPWWLAPGMFSRPAGRGELAIAEEAEAATGD